MPKTSSPPPALRLHAPSGCPGSAPLPRKGNPFRPPVRSADDLDWWRFGRLPNGAAPGCVVDFVVHEGRPPADVVAGWHQRLGKFVSIRVVDPVDELGAAL